VTDRNESAEPPAGPFFSVVIPTRNRPAPFRDALASVLEQSCTALEVIVVDDGSSDEHRSAYRSILDGLKSAKPVRSFALVPRPQGHGGSYARNFGAAKALAPYLSFLDDDDLWTDRDHLRRAYEAIAGAAPPVDLYLSNQAAFKGGERQKGPFWLEDLSAILAKSGRAPDRRGLYTVTVEELLQSQGFAHLNTLIVRRALFEEIAGFDERNGWEHDRDLYLRLIDRAAVLKYAPIMIARHNIPDPRERASVTTAQSEFEKRLSQLRLLDRAIFSSAHPAIAAHARRHKAYTLKRIAESLAAAGRYREAAFYAREALGAGPTVKWAAYTIWLTLRGMLR
jgi:glycosyltransferase involved in cell wall biosynthesis